MALRSLPYRGRLGWELLRSQSNDVCRGPCCMYGASGCRQVRHLPCEIEMESMLVDYLYIEGPGDPGDMGWIRPSVHDVLRSSSFTHVDLCEIPVRIGWFVGSWQG